MWLKEVGEKLTRSMSGGKVDLAGVVNNNPLPGKPSMENPADWAYIHFQLAMKYSTAVLSGNAFIPSSKAEILFEGEVSRV
jgi:hypothetical protein